GITEDGRLIDYCIELYDNVPSNNKYGILRGFVFFIRRTTYSAYDVVPIFCAVLYLISTLILFYKRRWISSTRNYEWKILGYGVVIFSVYGVS
ncbi:hypothetical protein PFISCL1PPCAC_15167, partial [Pristionchus fissidentatus]